MKYYFIAGENSGDFIGAQIIRIIKKHQEFAQTENIFYGVGGSKMQAAGHISLFNFEQINLMGFAEIIPHIFRLKKLINLTVEDILVKKPDIVVTIDSPGFCLRVAERIKKLVPRLKLIHIVAPSVWAYKEKRAKKFAAVYDKLLTLFEFETEYFTKYGLDCQFIGHPFLEQNFYRKTKALHQEFHIPDNHKVICVTPGSRKGELAKHMPVIKEALDKLSSTQPLTAIFVQPNETYINLITKYLAGAKFSFQFSMDNLKVFALSDLALAKSGTNTLEIAASGTPMIVGYKLNSISFMLLKAFIKIKYASVINVVANKEIIPEYLQSDFTADNIVYALSELLADFKKAQAQVKAAQIICKQLGLGSATSPSEKAAQLINASLR